MKRPGLPAALLAGALALSAAGGADAAPERRPAVAETTATFALIIGVNASPDPRLAPLQYADDAKVVSTNLNSLFNWRTEGEEIVRYFRSNDADFLLAVVFRLSKETSFRNYLGSCPLEFGECPL